MGIMDNAKHKAEQLAGRGKEAAGAATDNEELKNAGKRDQLSGEAKEAAQNAKDKAAGAVQDAKDKFGKNQNES